MRTDKSRSMGVWLVVLGVCLLVPAVALATAGAQVFRGHTSQHQSIKIEIENGKVLQKPSIIHWRATCTVAHGRRTYPMTASTDFGGKMNGNTFAAHGKYTSYPGGPAQEVNTAKIQFKLSGRKIKGTFSLSAVIYYEGTTPPTLSERCKTGTIHFTAKR